MLATASLLRVGLSLGVLVVLGACSPPPSTSSNGSTSVGGPASLSGNGSAPVSGDTGARVPFRLVYETQRGLDCPAACVARLTLTEDGALTYLRSDGAASTMAVVDTARLATAAIDSVQMLLDEAGFFTLPTRLPEQITGFSGSTARIRYDSAARSHAVEVLPDALTPPGQELAPAVRVFIDELRAFLLYRLGIRSDGVVRPIVD